MLYKFQVFNCSYHSQFNSNIRFITIKNKVYPYIEVETKENLYTYIPCSPNINNSWFILKDVLRKKSLFERIKIRIKNALFI